MTGLFVPLYYAFRRLALRAPEGSRTPPVPILPPPGLEPPPELAEAENGYRRLARAVEGWPEEGPFPPDLVHWRESLPGERKAAESALAPLRPYLGGVDAALDFPLWQTPIAKDGGFPELSRMRRLAQALLLRGALDDRREDRDRAVELARRLRRSQGPSIHFLVGLAVERQAEGSFEALDEDRMAAAHWELARFVIPRAHLSGPWEPPESVLPVDWADARRATAWVVSGHPRPYDPAATVAALVAERDLLGTGEASELQAKSDAFGAGWPSGMVAPDMFGPGRASLAELRKARIALQEVENPYGRLSICRTFRAAASLAAASQKARQR